MIKTQMSLALPCITSTKVTVTANTHFSISQHCNVFQKPLDKFYVRQ